MIKTKTLTVDRCIYLKSGSYYVVKRNQWSDPFQTKKEAIQERDRLEAKQAPKPVGGPFADFVRKYYYPHYMEKMRSNTQFTLKRNCERDLIPFFAKQKIGNIAITSCLDFQQSLKSRGLGESTINTRITILRQIFKAAIELGFIEKNPVENVRDLRVPEKDRPVLTEREIIDLVEKIDHPYRYATALIGLAGARPGEIMGFQWRDFEFLDDDKGKITFTRQINRVYEIDVLKTKGSQITLPMLKPLTRFLKEWREKCPDDEWLFQGEVAKYINKIKRGFIYKYHSKPMRRKYDFNNGNNLTTWWSSRIRDKYGLENMRFYDLRHSFATNMVTRCANIKTAQKFIRHANINTTLEIYAHVRPEQIDEVWHWDF